ncbi:MAG: D-glycero-beta-D-manno-heptose-7-phosphate kinase [Candidatus Krumholzibacteria bacterium]|nr:D-glycero-beta-D-manno-heptose-7-phosphate kinase [Candidatus Krumholzibacteria bacterium]
MSATGLSHEQAHTYIDKFGSAQILVIGDIMLDRYFWGEVDRISPEAPVPVVRVNRRSTRLGGAGNVAANLRGVGVKVALAGVIGDDRAGDSVRELLASLQISAEHLITDGDRETTEKVRIIAQSQQVVRADFEADSRPVDDIVEGMLLDIAANSNRYDALIISDYGKGVIREHAMRELINGWRRMNRPILVDPHVGHFRWYRNASIVTPNTKEAASYFGSTIRREELFTRLGFQMREELELEALLITRGEEGMSLFLENNERIHIPTVAKEVYDVTGAGDTVISVLGAAIACGAPLLDAVVLANRAAGEVVKEVGTTVITRNKLVTAFS